LNITTYNVGAFEIERNKFRHIVKGTRVSEREKNDCKKGFNKSE
jgi:hypothetical protein